MDRIYSLYSAVQTEVISLNEAKLAIKIDSTDFDDNIGVSNIVSYAYHAITATATSTSVSISGEKVIICLQPTSLSASSTLDVKLQESLDNVSFTDVSSGAFTQVTTANDTTIQEKEYTGTYPYIRAVYTITGAQASFGINSIISEATSIEDSYISDLISSAREYAEQYLNRAIGSQKWKILLDDFPDDDFIELPFPPLTNIDSVTYIAYDGTSATMSASESSGYIVDTSSEPGKIFLSYGGSWPNTTLYPHNGVQIIITCGYTSITCPKKVKDAILKLIGGMYYNRQSGIPKIDLEAIDNLLRGVRIINHGKY